MKKNNDIFPLDNETLLYLEKYKNIIINKLGYKELHSIPKSLSNSINKYKKYEEIILNLYLYLKAYKIINDISLKQFHMTVILKH